MSSKNKFYVVTPIYYANADPHIGSTYTTLAADVLARFHRMVGDKTFFLTGTDEHGAKIAEYAKRAGKSPQEFTDELVAKFELVWDNLAITNDGFIRTTDKRHIKASQKALQHLYDKGFIYKGEYKGLYCVGCEQYKTEKDLVDGKCPDHGTEPEEMKEDCYMFKLSAFQDELLKKIEGDEFKIRPKTRKNEVLSFYKNNGLADIACSRKNIKWGIELPWDREHTAYVWMEAFLNYLTGIGWTGDPKKVPEMWPADVQLMAKDILRVHASIWPAMLLALEIPLPKKYFVHGYFLVDGQKMSKSIGNVIAPGDLVQKYGVDGTRYLLMSAATFGRDGDISWEKFNEKFNADLANGIGNLVARSITLADKMRLAGLSIPVCVERPDTEEKLKKWGGRILNKDINKNWKDYKNHMKNIEIDKALEVVMNEQKYLDGYITEHQPWVMIKEGNKDTGIIMYNILERLRHVALMLFPFMPEVSEKIITRLGLDFHEEISKNLEDNIKFGLLKSDTKAQPGDSLFPRLDTI
ncbi:methionine--tRNA ligase [Candidatus Falkowbacteria bacterium RIFOXYB2_FULL_34_18]|uniref:Methionine--tRNA ligase n=1 Tax=Candidatus Falkowbacteria bacterium RIFOXYD2_FULL_34_120 TaxID=1798007 RepID=A0A1F5TST1_9BACT|nr:MAG: methionine--tRNA ligase [Candidatus Falkowbacteria bacterium RIFOXYB2_FULL_34_18]OGF30155.1 MAG: methionine--tRNA ligase [Candidatus Falkowbacteria bacterium RIFOXYC12_FULL_34_55]OGF37709.1 MAG: methionine--tRNA ligase [Candidatus Falkowbacteria bacterium RIFOXYC2_FULL_34_220]OGF39423.1 MAG: methionine--tRNA ligase [Candidatus Falkowbacteria bacterium RIFOXYD12_FULL_34_57]OGF41888.1 MAG: methionine--tRNA ligase [Candidatus Falkowbacteria bacterium RIFOXYD2_FULL_34_120]